MMLRAHRFGHGYEAVTMRLRLRDVDARVLQQHVFDLQWTLQ
jgi:hypothetical protein